MSDRDDPLLRRTTELGQDYPNGLASERFPSSGRSRLCLDGVFLDHLCGDTAGYLGDGDGSLDEASLTILSAAPASYPGGMSKRCRPYYRICNGREKTDWNRQ